MSSSTEEVMKDWISMLPWDHPAEIRLREALLAWETERYLNATSITPVQHVIADLLGVLPGHERRLALVMCVRDRLLDVARACKSWHPLKARGGQL